jgi:hypothetical protein
MYAKNRYLASIGMETEIVLYRKNKKGCLEMDYTHKTRDTQSKE